LQEKNRICGGEKMELFSLDQSKELDIIFLGRVAIDFNPAYSKEVKEEYKKKETRHEDCCMWLYDATGTCC